MDPKNIFVIFSLFFLKIANADTVHLGLKINYQTAMSHVEKKDLPVIEMLSRIAVLLPESKFLISGHTDIIGSYDVNFELSKGRASIVKILMLKKGVADDRIETKWFSYDAPIASNETIEGRSRNRRTVATVYGLTSNQAKKLATAAGKSKRFYVIAVESEKVDDYITNVLEPQIVPPAEPTIPEVNVEENVVVEAEQKAEAKQLGPEEVTEPVSEEIKPEESVVPPVMKPEVEDKVEATIEPKVESKVEPKPTPKKVKVKKKRKRSNKHRYFLGWALTDNELAASRTGFEAIWVTDFNQKISLGYQYKINDKYWFGASGHYSLQNYRIENNPIFNWDGITPNLMKLALNLDYQRSAKWFFGFDVNYSEENFVISNGLNIALNKVGMFGVSGRGLYKFYDSKHLSSRINLTVEYPVMGSDPIDPKGGLGFIIGTDVTLKSLSKRFEVNVGAFYGVRNFENIQNKQTENLIGVEIKVRNKLWP